MLVTAPMRLTHAALRQMTQRHTGGIINVSSVAGTQPRGSYSAAKAYLNRFGEWAAHEYAKDGVHIMTVLPGFTRTEFHARMDVGRDAVPSRLWLDADRVVDEALADFDAGKRVSIPSKRYKVIATASKHAPGAAAPALPVPRPPLRRHHAGEGPRRPSPPAAGRSPTRRAGSTRRAAAASPTPAGAPPTATVRRPHRRPPTGPARGRRRRSRPPRAAPTGYRSVPAPWVVRSRSRVPDRAASYPHTGRRARCPTPR